MQVARSATPSQEFAIAPGDQLEAAFERAANTIFEGGARAPPRLGGSLSTENNRRDIAIACAGPMTVEGDQSVAHREARGCPGPIFETLHVVTEDLAERCKAITDALDMFKTVNMEEDACGSDGHGGSIENDRERLPNRFEIQVLRAIGVDHEMPNAREAFQAESAIGRARGRARQGQGQSFERPKDIGGGCELIGIYERSKGPTPRLYGSGGVVCRE